MNIQISNKNFDLTQPFKQYLEEKLNNITKYNENITSCRVILSRDQHHNKGEVFTIEVNINIPRKSELIIKETQADARAAVDIIQDKIIRQLVKNKEKKKGKLRKKIEELKNLKVWNKE